MSLTCKLYPYKIDRCGYYKRKAKDPRFGDIGSILPDIRKWTARQDELRDAMVSQKDGFGLYIHKISRFDDDWFLSIWNEVPASRRGAMSVPGSKPPGKAKIEHLKSSAGAIVGFPSYFWFPGSHGKPLGIVLALRIPTAPRSIRSIRQAMRGFLERHSQYAIAKEDGDTVDILGFSKTGEDDPEEGVFPSFKISKLLDSQVVEWLRDRCNDISRVMTKGGYERVFQSKNPMYNVIRKIGIGDSALSMDKKTRASIALVIPVDGLTKDSFNAIVAKHFEGNEWDDLGFMMKGSSKTYWLSKSDVKVDQPLEIGAADGDVVELERLAKALLKHRDKILGSIGY